MSAPLRVLICGDRRWGNSKDTTAATAQQQTIALMGYVSSLPPGSTIIEGEASGADKLAARAARIWGHSVEPFPAEWKKYGRAAGPIRNKQMLTEGKPDLVVAFHDDIDASRGTKNMIEQAQKAGLPTQVRTSYLLPQKPREALSHPLAERCRHPLGMSENLAVTCALPLGHPGDHRSVFSK